VNPEERLAAIAHALGTLSLSCLIMLAREIQRRRDLEAQNPKVHLAQPQP